MSFKINDRCSGCTACAAICPTGAIRGENRQMHVIDPAKCIDCGACGVTCPDAAVLDHQGALFTLCEASERTRAWVDLARCSGCGWCRSTCHWDAIEPALLRGRDGLFRVATVRDRGCVACGACEVECAHGAIRVLRASDPTVDAWRVRNEQYLRARGVLPPDDAV